MQLTNIFVAAVALFAGVTVAAPAAEAPDHNILEKRGTCTKPIVRKEWRQLNVLEQANYLLAVKCMTIKPSKRSAQFPAAKTRWDDFVAIHQEATPRVHFNGQFLPWHRAFLHEFETALRQECFYFGAQPYWDHTRDQANIFNSPLFNDIISFGGNGSPLGNPGQTGGGCITDGLFKDTVINIAPQRSTTVGTTRCIKRSISQAVADLWFTPAVVNDLLATNNYPEFAQKLEGDIIMPDFLNGPFGIHNAGHAAIGGDMTDMYTSPLDPVFWLHHANVDRMWAKWQAANPSARQFAMGLPFANRPNPGRLNWDDAPAGDITLAYPISIDGTNIEVGQIMDTKGTSASGRAAGVLCYSYNA